MLLWLIGLGRLRYPVCRYGPQKEIPLPTWYSQVEPRAYQRVSVHSWTTEFCVISILEFSLILNLVAVMITHGNLISAALQFVILGEEFTKVQGVSPFPFAMCFVYFYVPL